MDVWKQFENNDITHSAAHHLLAVYHLRKKRGYARVTDIARSLNVTAGAVSSTIKSLKEKVFLVEDENRFLMLSESGRQLVEAILARKQIFKTFLTTVLSVSEKQAEIDSCKTEHLLSHAASKQLLAFLQLPTDIQKDQNQLPDELAKLENTAFCPHISETDNETAPCTVCAEHCLMKEC